MVMVYNYRGGVKVKERKSELSLVMQDRSECCSLSLRFLNLNGNIRSGTCITYHDDRLKEVLLKNQYTNKEGFIMSTYKVFIGIDVSKKYLNAAILNGDTTVTFKSLYCPEEFEKELNRHLKEIKKSELLIVMEHTGVYHLRLAHYLYESGYNVGVINPYSMRKFFEAKGKRAKTDKVDSIVIAEYGRQFFDGKLYRPKTEAQKQIETRLRLLDDFQKQINMVKNQREALSHVPMEGIKKVLRYYDGIIKALSSSMKKVEKEIQKLCREKFKKQWELLESIPGISDRAISVVVSMLRGFEGFSRAKEVGSFVGICPSPYESGDTVRGRGSIMKRGNSYVRKVFYMCTLSAIRVNVYCKGLYERLLKKGKSKKLALVAVGHKLLRQCFGVLRSGKEFNPSLVKST
ncbi:pilin inverting protein, putative [Thermodesulfovibrio yellowstonii DSM 11347]|uniref:Pilin inverting protein, putative n=2 Tax=Thermodesulfovibrio yellowstonii TaxID=28262 RepID=B5YKB4_THEYD|nr:pilin inverting protein, putative [Thermodesulfovibrio yellowstonii DSM 11347]